MTKAIIWIASGEKYVQEAIVSAKSVKRHNPDIPMVLCQPQSDKMIYAQIYFDEFILLAKHQYDLWFLDCTKYLRDVFDRLAYDQILLFDTDTYICDDLADYFTILDRFDIVGTHAPGRETAPTVYDVPASFPDLHIGAMSFNRNNTVKALFSSWLKLYQNNQDIYNENDQAPLRDALWGDPRVSVYAMPPEFCFRFPFGGQLRGKVRVLHGRSKMPYDKIEEVVNQHWRKIRVFPRGFFR